MRVSLWMTGAVAVCAVLLGTLPALHGQEKASGGDLEQQRADLIADLGLAAQLAAFGNGELNAQSGLPKDFRSPEALAAAGTMLLRAHKLTGGQQTPAGEVTEEGQPVAATANPSSLLDEAKLLYDSASALAEGAQKAALDKLIKSELENLKKEERPAVGGPRYISRTVRSGKKQEVHISFEPGAPASIAMQGTGTTQFEVVGQGGRVLWHSKGSWGYYNFVPGQGGGSRNVTVRVINRGGPEVSYTIRTN